jgi:signal transduction histidine kinase
MSLGANDYLTKPIQVDELLQSIKIQLWKKEKLENKIYNTWLDVSAHVPHELRTPLVSILGFSKIIADEVHDLSDDEITEIADKINFSGKRLHRTIEKFLRFTDIQVRIINKKRHLYNENNVFTDTSDTIELICRKMAKDANRHDDLILEISDVRLPVDSIDFEFIVDELMNNALKFSKPGSVINVTSHIMDDCYFLEITDHGKGMTKEQIAEISPFTQHDRKDFQQMGNGLGLISVKRLADFYKGHLKLYSEVNKFTTCAVTLPTYKVVEENQIKAETV